MDAYLAGCDLPVGVVVRCGDPVFPNTQPDGRRHDQSGLRVVVNEADFHEFPRQVQEAVAFLKRYDRPLRRLGELARLADTSIDFGVVRQAAAVQCYSSTAELL